MAFHVREGLNALKELFNQNPVQLVTIVLKKQVFPRYALEVSAIHFCEYAEVFLILYEFT